MSLKRGLRLKGLRMVVVYLVGMCFAKNRTSAFDYLAVKFLRGWGRGRGAHDCRTITPGLNGLLEPPKTVSAFTVVASENFTDFSVTTE